MNPFETTEVRLNSSTVWVVVSFHNGIGFGFVKLNMRHVEALSVCGTKHAGWSSLR